MGFKTLLKSAQQSDVAALEEIICMYKPLIAKESILDGDFDQDLFQELQATLVKCIRKINNF